MKIEQKNTIKIIEIKRILYKKQRINIRTFKK